MDEVQKQAMLGVVRNALVALGGIVATYGWIDKTDIDLYAGALVIVIGAAWSIWDKVHSETKTQAREVVAVQAGIAHADAIIGPTPPVTPQEAQTIIKTAQGPPVIDGTGGAT